MVEVMYRWLLVASCWLLVSIPRSANYFSLEQTESLHPYYISVVEINHNATDKSLEISCKIFTNDFETTLEKNYKTKVETGK
jgi:hypothetical protein